jgi:hypothetical protein
MLGKELKKHGNTGRSPVNSGNGSLRSRALKELRLDGFDKESSQAIE